MLFHSIRHPKNIILYPLVMAAPYGSAYTDDRELQIECEREGKKILRDKKKMFDEAELPVEIRLIKDEDPEDYIERIIKEEEFDLVVIGLKGVHSKLRQMFIGSVAKKVVKHASCDVLVVR